MRNLRVYVVAVAAMTVAACTGNPLSAAADQSCEQALSGSVRKPRSIVAAIDLSASRSTEALAQDRAAVEQLVSQLSYCDQIVIMEIQSTEIGPRDIVVDTMPSAWDPQAPNSLDEKHLQNKRRAVLSVVPLLYESARARKAQRTKIFATLHTASEYFRDAKTRHRFLILLTDMLESSTSAEMSVSIPSARWIKAQRDSGLIASLDGACVLAIGPETTSMQGIKLRNFWTAYFAAADARFPAINWRQTLPSVSSLGCE